MENARVDQWRSCVKFIEFNCIGAYKMVTGKRELWRGTGGSKVLRTPLGVRRMRPMMEGTERGRCFLMRSLVGSGQVAKKPLSMALQKIDLAGNPAVAWRNVAKAGREGW